MIGPESRAFLGPARARRIIVNRRAEKQDAKDILLFGGRSVGALASVMQVLNESVHGIPWVEKREERVLQYFRTNGSKEFTGEADLLLKMRERYQSGLGISVRQINRLRIEKGKQERYSDLQSTEGIQEFLLAYTFDFYRTIMECRRNGAPLTRGVLHLAGIVPYKFDPRIVSRLCKMHPLKNPLTIVYTLINSRANPELALRGTGGTKGKRSGETRPRGLDRKEDTITYRDIRLAWEVVIANPKQFIGGGKDQLSSSELKKLNIFFGSNGMKGIDSRLLRKLVRCVENVLPSLRRRDNES